MLEEFEIKVTFTFMLQCNFFHCVILIYIDQFIFLIFFEK